MKTILLPFYDDEVAESALDQACHIADRFGGHVEGLFVMRPPQIIEAEGIALAGAYITQLKEEWRRRAETARARFHELVEARGLALRPVAEIGEGTSANWRELEGPEGQIIGDLGRLFDIIVVARTSEQALIDWQVMSEAAFFESGRPTLVASRTSPAEIGRRIIVHWNGSTEVARAITFARPFLERAELIRVVTIDGIMVPGPTGEEMVAHLKRNGFPAEAVTVSADAKVGGEALMDKAHEIEADLLVKGAYTQNRLRQLVFGGVTRYVLNSADIPMVMAH